MSSAEPQAGPSEEKPAVDDKATVDLDAELKAFYGEVKQTDRSNEVMRILNSFKLNPYECLNLRFDVEENDIRKQFRKVSVLIHPDKCSHPRAKEAFERLGEAVKQLTSEEETFAEQQKELKAILNIAKDEVLKERAAKVKRDQVVQVAAFVHAEGSEGVERDWQASDDFHELWKAKAREFLAKAAFRKRKVIERVKKETDAELQAEQEEIERKKRAKKDEKTWAAGRDERVGSWREFQKGKKKATWRGPKLRNEDKDNLYVRRPTKPRT
ncbi:unnamed protein product [Pedinophyceae sp. YPF-701]|nr:unnamed protein product [Pedinophyceae sp. YPF-701]